MSAIEIKLETFRYKQTYESYITFSKEAKYGILISIRIVYWGLRAYIYSTFYIYKTQSLSVCMSAIEIKLETFKYKQTYESYITFSKEAKYGILISIRIVYGGLRAYIYSTYIVIQCKNSITNHKQNVRKVYI